jgi:hypothetical protein
VVADTNPPQVAQPAVLAKPPPLFVKAAAVSAAAAAPPATTAPSNEADDWSVHAGMDDSQRRTIYFHKPTSRSTFEKPGCLKTALELARDAAAGSGDAALIQRSVREAEREERAAAEDRFMSGGGLRRNEMTGYLDADSFQQVTPISTTIFWLNLPD